MEEISSVVNSIAKILECVICLNVSDDPVSIGCGHFFCRECITTVLKENFRATCPLCMKMYTKRSIQEAAQRKSIAKAMKSVVEAAEKVLGYLIVSPSDKKLPSLVNENLPQKKSRLSSSKLMQNIGQRKRKILENEMEKEENTPQGFENQEKDHCLEIVKKSSGNKGNERYSQKQFAVNSSVSICDDDDDVFQAKPDKEGMTQQTNLFQFIKKLKKNSGDDAVSTHDSNLASDCEMKKLQSLQSRQKKNLPHHESQESDDEILDERKEAAENPKKSDAILNGCVPNNNNDEINELDAKAVDTDCYTFVSSQNSALGKPLNVRRKKRVMKIQKSKIKKFVQVKRRKKSSPNREHTNAEILPSADMSLTKLQSMPLENTTSSHDLAQNDSINLDKGHIDKATEEKFLHKDFPSESRNFNSSTFVDLCDDNLNLESHGNKDASENHAEKGHPPDIVRDLVHSNKNVDEYSRESNSAGCSNSPVREQVEESTRLLICKSPGWSRIKQMNKDFNFKTFPTLHVQKGKVAAAHSTLCEIGEDNLSNAIDQKAKEKSIVPSASYRTVPDEQMKTSDAACSLISSHKLPTNAKNEKTCNVYEEKTDNQLDGSGVEVNGRCEEGVSSCSGSEMRNTEGKKICETDYSSSICTFIPETVDVNPTKKQNTVLESEMVMANGILECIEFSLHSPVENGSESKVAEDNSLHSKISNHETKSPDISTEHKLYTSCNTQGSIDLSDVSKVKETRSFSPDVLVSDPVPCTPKSPDVYCKEPDTPTSSHTLSQAFSHKKIRKRLHPITSSPISNKSGCKVSKRKSHLSPRCKRFMSLKRAKKSCSIGSMSFDHSIQRNESIKLNAFSNTDIECRKQLDFGNQHRSIFGNRSSNCNLSSNCDIGKKKVIKRLCLTFEEIETYFKNFYESGETEMICCAPLPSSDLMLQLNVSDETLNISVLKVLRENNLGVQHASNSNPNVKELCALQECKEQPRMASDAMRFPENNIATDCSQSNDKVTSHETRKHNKQKDSWYYDENNSLLPDTQPVQSPTTVHSPPNPKAVETLGDKEIEISEDTQSKSTSQNKSVSNATSIIKPLSNNLDVEITPDIQETNIVKEDKTPEKVCDTSNSQSLFAVHNTSSKAHLVCNTVNKLNENLDNGVASNTKRTRKQSQTKSPADSQNVFNSNSNTTETENNKEDFTASLANNDRSMISPTYEDMDRQNELCEIQKSNVINSKETQRDIMVIDKSKPVTKDSTAYDDRNMDYEDVIPQSYSDSQEDAIFREVDPFADTDDFNALEPKLSETKLEDLVVGSEDYSSDPDMIFANSLVAPLKSIAQKMNKDELAKNKLNRSNNKSMLQKSSDDEDDDDSAVAERVNNKGLHSRNRKSLENEDNAVHGSVACPKKSRFNKLSKSGKAFKRIVTLASDDSDDAPDDIVPICQQKKQKESPSIIVKAANMSKLNDSKNGNDSTLHSILSSEEVHTGAVNQMKLEIQQMNEKIKMLQEKIAGTSDGESSDEDPDSGSEKQFDKDGEKFQKPRLIPSRRIEEAEFSDDSKESSDLFMGPIPPTPPI